MSDVKPTLAEIELSRLVCAEVLEDAGLVFGGQTLNYAEMNKHKSNNLNEHVTCEVALGIAILRKINLKGV